MEIERKYLISTFTLTELFRNQIDSMEIADIYLGERLRIRKITHPEQTIATMKSKGTLLRDEYEMLLENFDFNLINLKPLWKLRFKVKYNGHICEVNHFYDISYANEPLIILETELDNINQVFYNDGIEVTENKEFYGYNLFKRVQEGRTNIARLENDITR